MSLYRRSQVHRNVTKSSHQRCIYIRRHSFFPFCRYISHTDRYVHWLKIKRFIVQCCFIFCFLFQAVNSHRERIYITWQLLRMSFCFFSESNSRQCTEIHLLFFYTLYTCIYPYVPFLFFILLFIYFIVRYVHDGNFRSNVYICPVH